MKNLKLTESEIQRILDLIEKDKSNLKEDLENNEIEKDEFHYYTEILKSIENKLK